MKFYDDIQQLTSYIARVLCAKCQGNAGECRGMPGERMGVGAKSQGNAGKCMGVGANYQWNAEECQGNVREWVQSARGIQGNAGEYQVNVLCAKQLTKCADYNDIYFVFLFSWFRQTTVEKFL